MSIFVKIFEIPRFWIIFFLNPNFSQNFRIISILVKFSKNLKLCQTFEKFKFGSNFRKISIGVKLSKNPDFGENFRKLPILTKILESLDFGEYFRSISISVKIFEKSSLRSNFSKNGDFGQIFQ